MVIIDSGGSKYFTFLEIKKQKQPFILVHDENQHSNGFIAGDLSESAYLAQDIPPGLCGEHLAAVRTGRRAIYREALGS